MREGGLAAKRPAPPEKLAGSWQIGPTLKAAWRPASRSPASRRDARPRFGALRLQRRLLRDQLRADVDQAGGAARIVLNRMCPPVLLNPQRIAPALAGGEVVL